MTIHAAHELCSAVGELSCGSRKDPVEHRLYMNMRLRAGEISFLHVILLL